MADVIEIGAEVRERELRLTSITMMPSGSRNHLRIRITFDAEWEGTTKTLVAYRDLSKPYHAPLGLDGTALIPHEVLAEQGVVYLGVFGVAGDQRITSTIVRYGVNEGAVTDGLQPSDPTPEMWDQLISAVNEVRQAAESAMRDAQTAAQSAQQSEQAAAGSATQADGAATRAETAAGVAETAKTDAQDAQRAAAQSAADAQKSAARAEQAAGNLSAAVTQAQDAAQAAQQSATQAQDHAKSAGDSAASAAQAQQGATDAESAARQSAAQAQSAQETATQAATESGESARQAAGAQTAAQNSAQSAGGQANAAATSAQQAQQSQTAAAESATSAQASAAEATKQAGASEASAVRAEKSAEDAKTAAERAETMIDDNAVKSDKTWSSKNIVDMLCPPINERGNPVVCTPVAGYPLGITASWGPTQEGVGDPSPENIRPIKGRNSVTVERCGENLLPHFDTEKTSNGVRFVYKSGRLSVSGSPEHSKNPVLFFDDDAFTNLNFIITALRGKRIVMNGLPRYTSLALYSGDFSVGITLGNGKSNIVPTYPNGLSKSAAYFQFAGKENADFAGTPVLTFAEVDDLPNGDWLPFRGDTNTLALPSTIYGGEVDAVSGKGQEMWKLVTLMGEEGWAIRDGYIGIYNLLPPVNAGNAICTHFAVKNNYNGDCLIVTGAGTVYLGTALTNKYTVDTWCAYLAAQYAAGTPVQIAYQVADPTPFTATGNAPITAIDGTNTILTDADSVTVTGRADPTAYYGNKIAEISAAIVAR